MIVVALLVAILALGAASIWLKESPKGTEIMPERAALAQARPDVFFLGNSMMGRGIDLKQMEDLLQQEVDGHQGPGSGSAYWYVYFKNVILATKPPPQVVVLFFRNRELTDTRYRTDPPYRLQIENFSLQDEPELMERAFHRFQSPLDRRMKEQWKLNDMREMAKSTAENTIRDVIAPMLRGYKAYTRQVAFYQVFHHRLSIPSLLTQIQLSQETDYPTETINFEESNPQSFLPLIVEMAKQHDVQLILVRVRKRSALTKPQPPELLDYIASLNAYAAENSVPILDFMEDERIQLKHFVDGDHMNEEGRELLTRLVAEKLLPLLPVPRNGPKKTGLKTALAVDEAQSF